MSSSDQQSEDLTHFRLATAKQQLNQTFLPDPAHLQATEAAFGEVLRSPQAEERMAKARERGLNTANPFKLELGRAIADLSD